MSESELTEVALFPIPNMVAFPGTVVPLHVFEPRYRQLVADCLEADRMIGVCHTLKTIRQPPREQTIEEALSSNQATYKPQPIFSAGDCEVLDTTEDGRIIARINMRERLRLVGETQSLPYRIVTCEPIADHEEATDSTTADIQHSINSKLLAMIGQQNPKLTEHLSGPEFSNQSAAEYSFAVFQFLKLDADLMQAVLESRSPKERLEILWGVLEHAS